MSRTNQVEIQSVIDNQLKQFYASISREHENRGKVRNWSVTLWVALIALFSSGRININGNLPLLILLFINVIFWGLESMHLSLIVINSRKVKKLEAILASGKLPDNLPLDLFYSNSDSMFTTKEKIKIYIQSFFLRETVTVYHLAMILGSIIFVLAMKQN